MATATLVPRVNGIANYEGTGETLAQLNEAQGYAASGGDWDTSLNSPSGSSQVENTLGSGSFDFFFQDNGEVPLTAVITSVTFNIKFKTSDAVTIHGVPEPNYFWSGTQYFVDLPTLGSDPVSVPSYTTFSSAVLTTNPSTGVAWVRANLFPVDPTINADGGWEFGYSAGSVTLDVCAISLTVAYTNNIWYYNPTTDSYEYVSSNPGPPWIQQDPVFRTYGQENPVQGVSTGGTPIVISGDGFGSGATVTVGGVDATSIVVVNQHTITCTTPAFSGSFTGTQIVDVSGVNKSAQVASAVVTVTNPDGTSASI